MEDLKLFFEKQKNFTEVTNLIQSINCAGYEAYIVGGAVRDAFLKKTVKDYDICTDAHPQSILKIFRQYKTLTHGIAYGTVTVVLDFGSVEITSYRGEQGYVDGRHPESIEFNVSLIEDLKRRDFTINTLLYHPDEGLVDYLGGIKDLKDKIIKTVGEAEKRFQEDFLRILRALRFSLIYDLTVEPQTYKAALKLKGKVLNLSKERVYNELSKVLQLEHLDLQKVSDYTKDFLSLNLDIHFFSKGFSKDSKKVFLLYTLFGHGVKPYLRKTYRKYLDLYLYKKINVKKILTFIEREKIFGEEFKVLLSCLERIHKNLEIHSSDLGLLSYNLEKVKAIHKKNKQLYSEKELGDKNLEAKVFYLKNNKPL